MAPRSWSNREVTVDLTLQAEVGVATLEESTDNGIVLTFTDENNNTHRVFYPWAVVRNIELTDMRGPA